MSLLRLLGINMADEASDTLGGGLKNWLGALGFILPLLGAEEILRWFFTGQGWPRVGLALIFLGLFLYVLPAVWKIGRRRFKPETVAALDYLHAKDSELGSAIRDMVWRSAWGKWYATQLFVNSGRPSSDENVLHVASHLVADQMINGDLEVRGRLPGRLDYEPIPRTHWRSSALHFVQDPATIWRMIIIPRGGAEIERSGAVKGHDPAATQRTATITTYDSMIVDAYQFEKLWPRRDRVADKKRHKLLRKARKRGLDKDEIQKLSQD